MSGIIVVFMNHAGESIIYWLSMGRFYYTTGLSGWRKLHITDRIINRVIYVFLEVLESY
jgi:hypothetical protein